MRDKVTSKSISKDHAEETAIAVLGWLATDPDRLGRFLALSGADPGQVRQAMGDPDFLAGLLDFIVQHEPDLLAFCAASGYRPETVMAAWQHYAGPALDSGQY